MDPTVADRADLQFHVLRAFIEQGFKATATDVGPSRGTDGPLAHTPSHGFQQLVDGIANAALLLVHHELRQQIAQHRDIDRIISHFRDCIFDREAGFETFAKHFPPFFVRFGSGVVVLAVDWLEMLVRSLRVAFRICSNRTRKDKRRLLDLSVVIGIDKRYPSEMSFAFGWLNRKLHHPAEVLAIVETWLSPVPVRISAMPPKLART